MRNIRLDAIHYITDSASALRVKMGPFDHAFGIVSQTDTANPCKLKGNMLANIAFAPDIVPKKDKWPHLMQDTRWRKRSSCQFHKYIDSLVVYLVLPLSIKYPK